MTRRYTMIKGKERSNQKGQRRAQQGPLRSDNAGNVWKRTRSSAWWETGGKCRGVRGYWGGGEEPDHTAFVKEDQSDFIQAQWKSITPLWKSVAFQRSRRVLRPGFTPQNFKISIRSLFPVPDNSRFWWTYSAFHKQVRGMWKVWNTSYLGRKRKVGCDKRNFHIVRSGEIILTCTDRY